MAEGTWSAAGELPTARRWFGLFEGAVPLDGGRVLVAGGADDRVTAVADVAVYDVDDNAWSVAEAMGVARVSHSMTRLADGRLLVCGGNTGPLGSQTVLATAEIYDPTSGTWSPTGAMRVPRWGHSATLLPDGRVLVAGGGGPNSPRTSSTWHSAELYDPGSGEWTSTDPMTDRRFAHAAPLLEDGRVMVIGGVLRIGGYQAVGVAFCELYDPATGRWTPTGSMHSLRKRHQATYLTDGTVLACGGDSDASLVDGVYNPTSQWTAERYDPAAGRWTRAGNMPAGRSEHRAVPLRSGRVLVIGGTCGPRYDTGYRSASIYDPLAGTWTAITGMATGRWSFTATALDDGRVLAVGGTVRSGRATAHPGRDLVTATAEILTLQGETDVG